MSSYTTTGGETLSTHTETYRGHDIRIARIAAAVSCRDGVRAGWSGEHNSTTINGRSFRAPVGTLAVVIKKLHAIIDTEIEDAAMIADITALVANSGAPVETGPVAVGDVAWVHAMGSMRRGRVIKTAKTRVTVAFTTASSNGRVFRKAAPADKVRVAA